MSEIDLNQINSWENIVAQFVQNGEFSKQAQSMLEITPQNRTIENNRAINFLEVRKW